MTSLTGSHLRIVLKDLVTEARVGLHAWEQHPERPTRLVVNVEMFAPLTAGLGGEGEADFVDYDPVRAAIALWPQRPHTPLLETLVAEVVGLCFRHGKVSACRVSVVKPDIFNAAAGAGVEAYVLRSDWEGWQ